MAWTPTTTFHDMLKLGIEGFSEDIKTVAEMASKEYGIEQTLDKMAAEWLDNCLDIQPYKETGIKLFTLTIF